MRITCGTASSDTHESIKALALLAHQVEVLFVMCTLLAGKRKVQVQDRLMELDIVPALLQMFDRLDWNRAPSTSPPMERYGRQRERYGARGLLARALWGARPAGGPLVLPCSVFACIATC